MQEENDKEVEGQTPEVEIDQAKYQQLINEIAGNQNLQLAIIGGIIAAIIGASLWAVITIVTDFQIGWMAVGVGFLVGYAVRITGKGITKIYGYIGGVLALLGCLAGNLFSVCAIISKQEGIPFFDILMRLNPQIAFDLMKATFSPIDLLFYFIAIYEGYRFSFRSITEEELADVVKTKS